MTDASEAEQQNHDRQDPGEHADSLTGHRSPPLPIDLA